jgi:hypothetical protein
MQNTLVAKLSKRVKVQRVSPFYEDDFYEIPIIQKGKRYETVEVKEELVLVKDEIDMNWYSKNYFEV